MIVIETLARFPIITGEPDSEAYRTAIKSASSPVISLVTLLETQIVLFARSGPSAVVTLDILISGNGINVIPFDELMAIAAFGA